MRATTSSSRSGKPFRLPPLGLLLLLLPAAILSGGERRFGGPPTDAPFGPARALTSDRGMVVSAASEASRAGAEILAAGGNAMD
ncbi:MAG: hypothetical protein KJ062_08470, partial [Thermoanaerobaculia bacterium]|nr:hypothetical protein [Thermoanaerobaculia bacterium]